MCERTLKARAARRGDSFVSAGREELQWLPKPHAGEDELQRLRLQSLLPLCCSLKLLLLSLRFGLFDFKELQRLPLVHLLRLLSLFSLLLSSCALVWFGLSLGARSLPGRPTRGRAPRVRRQPLGRTDSAEQRPDCNQIIHLDSALHCRQTAGRPAGPICIGARRQAAICYKRANATLLLCRFKLRVQIKISDGRSFRSCSDSLACESCPSQRSEPRATPTRRRHRRPRRATPSARWASAPFETTSVKDERGRPQWPINYHS